MAKRRCKDKAVHLEVIEMVIAFAKSIGFEILNLEFSPIKGPEGNIEYLLHLQNHPEAKTDRSFMRKCLLIRKRS